MRYVVLALALPLAAAIALWLSNGPLRPPPAAERLSGVTVAVNGYTITNIGEGHRRLNLGVRISSMRSLDECLGFTLDEAFGSRRFADPATGCLKPAAGATTTQIHFDGITDDDITFPIHTLVWGIPGGRCGLIYSAMGVCVVEQAGTVPVTFPSQSRFPTFGPIGTFAPIFTFDPYP